MLSSISNSRSKALSHAKLLLSICVITAVGLESVSIYLLDRHSVTYRRASRQMADAIAARTAESGSSLLLAHWSAFYGTHSIVRIQVLRRIIPNSEELFFLMPIQRNALLRNQSNAGISLRSRTVAANRLKTLRELCDAYGARMVTLIPPIPASENAARELAGIADKMGVPAFIPIDPAALTGGHYESDELHLNPEGAALFTLAIARLSDRFHNSAIPPAF